MVKMTSFSVNYPEPKCHKKIAYTTTADNVKHWPDYCTVVGSKYLDGDEAAAYHLSKKILGKLDGIKARCYIKYSSTEWDFDLIHFDILKYQSLYKQFLKNKDIANQILAYINYDYRKISTINCFSRVNDFVNKYIKINKKYIYSHLDINQFKDISYYNKYYDLYRSAERTQIRKYNKILERREQITQRISSRYNRFFKLEVFEGVDSSDDDMCTLECTTTPIKSSRKIWDDITRFVDHRAKPTMIPKPRNVEFLLKLHYILYKFRLSRKIKAFRLDCMPFNVFKAKVQSPVCVFEGDRMTPPTIQCEMMEDEVPSSQQMAGPVVLNALQQDSSVVSTQNMSDMFWTNNSTSDIIIDNKHSSQMELLVKSFEWSSAQAENTLLFSLALPIDALTVNTNHPATMLFSQYAYWNGDIKVRLHVNTTPFHIGKLILSWYYSEAFDGHSNHRNNIASSTLLPHVEYYASEGGDVILDIPYRSYRSMLCTRKKTSESKHLNLGNLRLHVFNPLILGESTSVNGYVHVSFINNKFTGIMPRQIIQPEMLPVRSLIKTTEGALTTLDKVLNMDKPSNPSVPIMFTPQFTDSFCSGNGDICNIHALRLDPMGQTPHPIGSSTTVSETLIKDLVRKWGLVSTFTWDTTKAKGTKLYTLKASPELNYYEYYQVDIQDGTDKYRASVLPPISAITTMNAYNRGSIEYKVEIICSRYHTGAIAACFTPILSDVTYEQALQSYYTTIDVGTSCEYVFKVPYINERPYNPRFNRSDTNFRRPQLTPIGEFNIFVMNELRVINAVSNKVYINLYIRAGDDFEVAIPVAPLYSCNYEYTSGYKSKRIHPIFINGTSGIASWRYASRTMGDKVGILKYDSGDDTIMQFDQIKPYTVYKLSSASNSFQDSPFLVGYYKKDKTIATGVSLVVIYIAMCIVNDDGNKYKYAIPFFNYNSAVQYVDVWKTKSKNENKPYCNSPNLDEWLAKYPDPEAMYVAIAGDDSYRKCALFTKDISFEEVYVQAEGKDIIVDPTLSILPSTSNGVRLFGEGFSDLKDYCRRFQPYAAFKIDGTSSALGIHIRVPITPIGLNCNNNKNGLNQVKTREGVIPYIASAYRFYRGSLRFKILVIQLGEDSSRNRNTHQVVYIQHRPDVIVNTRDIELQTVTDKTSPDGFLQSGYAYTAMSLDVNNSITIEIPCYIPTNLLLLQLPKFDLQSEILHYMNGSLDLFLMTENTKDSYSVQLHMALADDMDFSCYVGFPPMINLYNTEVVPQMADDKIKEKPGTSKDINAIEPLEDTSESGEEVISDKPGIIERTKGWFKEKKDKAVRAFALESVRTTLSLEPERDDSLGKLIGDAISKFGSEYRDIIISMVSQIVHCIMHPELSTFVLAVLTLLSHVAVNSFAYIKDFARWFKNLFTQSNQAEADDDKTEKSSIEESKTSIIRSIVEMGASTFEGGLDMIKNMTIPDFSKGVFANIRFGAMTINAVFTMFQNLSTWIPKILKWLGKVINPRQWIRWLFGSKNSMIESWITDVEYIIDPSNDNKRNELRYVYQTELLVIIGRDIMLKLDRLEDRNINRVYINNLNMKLNEVYKEMSIYQKGAGSIGIEPYCMCIAGESQVGKTYITKDVTAKCLEAIGYKSYEEIWYTRMSSSQYWDGVYQQPICLYDDFLHVKLDAIAASQLGEFLLLKSKATFQPNRAHLEDKGKKYSPLMVCLTMNDAYPDFKHLCLDETAWMNRRDDMFYARFVAPADHADAVNCKDLPKHYLETADFCYVRFKKYAHRNNSVANASSTFEKIFVPKMKDEKTFETKEGQLVLIEVEEFNYQQLKWYVKQKFVAYYESMKREYLKDLALAQQFYPDAMSDFELNISRYLKHLKNIERTYNEREKNTIRLAKKLLKNSEPCSQCNGIPGCCACECSIFKRYTNVQAEGSDDFFKVTKRSVSGKIQITETDYDKKVSEFFFFCKKKNFFMELPPYIMDLIMDEYRNSVKFGEFNPKFQDLIDKPCIHKVICHYVNDVSMVAILHEDNYKLFVGSYLYPLDNSICKCELTLDAKLSIKAAMINGGLNYDNINFLKSDKVVATAKPNLFKELMKNQRKEFMNELKKEIGAETWLGKLWRFVKCLAKPLIYIVGSIGALYGLVTLSSTMRGYVSDIIKSKEAKKKLNKAIAETISTHEVTNDCLENKCNICSFIPQMAYDQKHIIDSKKRLMNIPGQVIKVGAEMARETMAVVDKKLKRNYFYIRATTPDDREIIVRCLGLRSYWFIAIDHYFHKFETLPKGTVYDFCRADYIIPLNMNEVQVKKLRNSAIYMCQLPRTFQQFRDIVNLIAPARMIPNIVSMANLYVPDLPDEKHVVDVYVPTWYRERITLHDDTLAIPGIVNEELTTNVSAYWSYSTSGKGLCGSVLISDANIVSPIIGIHIAGLVHGGCGYSEVIVRETFENFFEELVEKDKIIDIQTEGMELGDRTIHFTYDPSKLKSALPGSREFVGCVSTEFSYKPATKSKLLHSLCYNEITTSTYDVPHLSHRDERFFGSPMVAGCLHHVDPPLDFPNDLLEIAYDDIRNMILYKVPPLRQRVGKLSVVEAIVGIHDIPNYDAMEFDTSEGFPFSSIRPAGAKDKKWLFDLEVIDNGYLCHKINPLLSQVMYEKEQLRNQGIVPATVFIDCLKDAKLPIEKCHKTRIFSISPVDFTIQFRQLFYDFTIAFQESRFNIESAVGINVDGYEWHNMIQKLLENSPDFVCGDYSKFGPRLMNKVVQLCFDIICEWYIHNGDVSQVNELHRKIMCKEISFSMHLMLNMIYQVYCGAPSGSPITTILNNMVNMFYIRVAYLSIMRKHKPSMASMTQFHENVCVIFYGDDLIMTVKNIILEFFNAQTLSAFFKEYNIVFTDALKTGDVVLSTTVFANETSFLKRTTKRHPFRPVFMAAMDRRSVEETCNWIFDGHDIYEASIIACEAMLLNAHGLGRDYYENLRARVYKFWSKYGEYPIIPSWVDVDYRIYEGGVC